MKRYKWRYDRVTAFAVALINCIFLGYVQLRLLLDETFLYTQTGLRITRPVLVVIFMLMMVLAIYLNLQFIKKSHNTRLILSACQTILLAFILRNIFVGHVYFGFGYEAYARNLMAFVVVAFLKYNTIFSKNIRAYFLQ